jgi:sugar phosphate isomerase/epimerase
VSTVNTKYGEPDSSRSGESLTHPWVARLAASTICFRRWPLRLALAEIAAAGITAADVGALPGYCDHFDPAGTPDDMERWAVLIESSGVRVHTINAGVGYFNDDASDPAGVRQRARHCLAAAARVGAHGVTLAPGCTVDRTARPLAGEIARVAPYFRELALEAESLGLVLSFEAPHKGGLILNATEARALVEAINHPKARLIFDLGHHRKAGWDLAEAWAVVGPWVDHVHLKDQAGGQGRYPLGAGEIDFPAFFDLAARSGYAGHFGFEFPDAAFTAVEVTDLLRRSREFVAALNPQTPCPAKSK